MEKQVESREPLLLITEISQLPTVRDRCKTNVFHEWNCLFKSGQKEGECEICTWSVASMSGLSAVQGRRRVHA